MSLYANRSISTAEPYSSVSPHLPTETWLRTIHGPTTSKTKPARMPQTLIHADRPLAGRATSRVPIEISTGAPGPRPGTTAARGRASRARAPARQNAALPRGPGLQQGERHRSVEAGGQALGHDEREQVGIGEERRGRQGGQRARRGAREHELGGERDRQHAERQQCGVPMCMGRTAGTRRARDRTHRVVFTTPPCSCSPVSWRRRRLPTYVLIPS